MVIKKCEKCMQGFRSSRHKETLCAKCEVDHCPVPENLDEVSEEFSQLVESTYGTGASDACLMNCSDVLNHRSRLLQLKEMSEKIADSKGRVRQRREIQRLLEEHEAVQDKIAKMQNEVMNAMFLHSSSAKSPVQNAKQNNTPENFVGKIKEKRVETITSPNFKVASVPAPSKPVESEPVPEADADQLSALQRNSSVKEKAKLLQSSFKKQSSREDESVKDCVDSKIYRPDLVTPVRAEPEDVESDQLMPLKRTNSVRNRIKAFEDLTRRASTGTFDRRSSPRRKLNF